MGKLIQARLIQANLRLMRANLRLMQANPENGRTLYTGKHSKQTNPIDILANPVYRQTLYTYGQTLFIGKPYIHTGKHCIQAFGRGH